MLSKLRSRLTYGHVVATLALFVALGGSAAASVLITSNSQVASNTISGHHPPSGDHSNIIGGSVNGTDLATGAVSTAKLGTGAVTTPKIANGAVTAPKLAPAAIGARAYGRVAGATVTRSKNVIGVTNPAPGAFCIALAGGIDASQTGLVVTPDFAADATSFNPNGAKAFAEWRSDAPDCPAGRLEVMTGARVVSTSGSTDGDVRTVNNSPVNDAFFFIVP